MAYKIVLTDSQFLDTSIEEEELAVIGAKLVKAKETSEEALIEIARDCDGIIVEYAKITEKVIKNLERCKVISVMGIGYDMVDIAAATEHGIQVANVPDYCLDEVADHAMALSLACARGVVTYHKQVVSGAWGENLRGLFKLQGRNFCIFGFGNIARKVAVRAKAFGYKVLAYDPYCNDEDFKKLDVIKVDSLVSLAEQADVLSIHAPLTASTKGIINRDIFSHMKKTAILVNTSRGPLINQVDLIETLKNQGILAAGLDVFEREPIETNSELLRLDNVILSPHIAFYSAEAEEEMRRRVPREIVYAFLEGQPRAFVNKNG